MIRTEDIVCFAGEDWWYHNPHSNLHIMKAWAKNNNRVLFVNSIGTRMPKLGLGKFALRRIVNKAKSMLRYLVRAEPGIYVLTPFAFPYIKGWHRVIDAVNTTLVTLQLRVVLRLLKFEKPIFWVCIPSVKNVVSALRMSMQPKCVVYYCVDNITYYSGEEDLSVLSFETALHRTADVALFVNRQLLRERSDINPRTYHLDHGVDYEHFARAQSGTLPVPHDIAEVKKPVMAYIGVLRGLDYELIRYLSEQNKDFSFVFIGEVNERMPLLEGLPNVHFLGKKAYEDLPNYMQAADCLTIFYKKEDVFNNYRNPKKLLEYFATGKPVISVPILELTYFDDMIPLPKTFEEFSRQLRECVFNDPASARQRRINYAQTHTWDNVAERASAYIRRFARTSL